MNYYRRHIGDYIRDTAHFTLLEHGIYARLMDVYYAREAPLPDSEVARLIGARSSQERKSLLSVLSACFSRDGDLWVQKRCDEEIKSFQIKAEHNRLVGHLGGRPVKSRNPDITQVVSENNPSHKPIASSHKPVTKKEETTEAEPPLPGWLDAKAFFAFKDHRKSVKAPMSARAQKLAIDELEKLKSQGHDPVACINQSILNGWKGIFPVKNGMQGKPEPQGFQQEWR